MWANLGWPTSIGCGEAEGVDSPALVWMHAMPPGGAAMYWGEQIPEWYGSFLVTSLGLDDGGQHLQVIGFDLESGWPTTRDAYLWGDWGRLRTVQIGPDGYPYVTTSNCDGRGECPDEGDMILRIVAA
jgi:glucose/arabinose dehydrogenase